MAVESPSVLLKIVVPKHCIELFTFFLFGVVIDTPEGP